MGLAAGGDISAKSLVEMNVAIERLDAIFDAALAVNPGLLLLSHGGPVATSQDAEYVNLRPKAVGFVAAPSFKRIRIEIALKQACNDFKSIRIA